MADKGRNMGLGKLKGVFQERRSRLDAAIEADSGKPRAAAKKGPSRANFKKGRK